jgi:histidine triad (HIT) family protein
MDCLFCQIRDKIIEKKFIYEDDDIMVFQDIHPVRPVHLLIVPKEHITELYEVEQPMLFMKLLVVIQNMIKREGLTDKGYRVTINGGGAQAINHFHLHLTGPLNKTVAI